MKSGLPFQSGMKYMQIQIDSIQICSIQPERWISWIKLNDFSLQQVIVARIFRKTLNAAMVYDVLLMVVYDYVV